MRDPRWSVVIFLAVAAGCDRTNTEPPADPTEVIASQPILRRVTDYEEFTGHTDAIKNVQIKARVSGYLLKKDFQDGEDVKQGDILYEIDDRPYLIALRSAEATVTRGEAHRTRLTSDFQRASRLFERAAIGKQEFDLAFSDMAEAEAQLAASKAQLENARLNMSFTKVIAPMDGKLSRTLIDPGNLIRQDATILNDILSTNELYVYFDVNADAMERVSRVIEQGHIGGKDNREVPVIVGTTVDADQYEEAIRGLRDLGDQILRLDTERKNLPKLAEEQIEKLKEEAELKAKKTTANTAGSSDKVEWDAQAARTKLDSDIEARKKKLVDDLAANEKAHLAKEKFLAEQEKSLPPEFPYNGLVNFSENKLDAATGTLRVRGTIQNPAPASILIPGLFVRIRLPIGESHEALLVPEDSIGSDQGKSFLYVIDEKDEIEYRPIESGALFDGEAGRKLRAIRKGIKAGERFVHDSDAIRRVRPGAKVKVDRQSVQVTVIPSATLRFPDGP